VQQRLIAIGDSITLGHWDPQGGWVARIRKESDEAVILSGRQRYAAVYNLGISSNMSADVRERYLPELSARLLATDDETAYVALAVGINDSQLREGVGIVDLGDYRANMESIIKQGLKRDHRVVIVGLTPVNEHLTDPVDWDRTKSFRNERIAEFDEVAREIARGHGLAFADLFVDPVLRASEIHLEWDGLHLNALGHQRVSHLVLAALNRTGWEP
jgi:lysophospholipase L1-like esterase